MAQASLNKGVGTWVKDTQAVTLLSESLAANDDGAWVLANHPGVVAFEVVTGTCTGTTTTCDIAIQAADNSSGTNTVTVGKFSTLTDASDNVTKVIIGELYGKPYVRTSAVVTGTNPVFPVVVKIRDKDYHNTKARTG